MQNIPKLSDIKEAESRICNIARFTPLRKSHTLSKYYNAEIYFKCENHQKTGSFKVRGASNKIAKLKNKVPSSQRFITASAGNHAQGVAFAATSFGFKSTVVMPLHAPLAKIEATKGYGADVELVGECFDDAKNYALNLDGTFIHPYDDYDVICGQGTIGLEILEKIPDVDIILVPAGGGGLLAGVASAAKQINSKIKVIGVQANNANAIVQSFKEKDHLSTKTSSTIADGIAVKNPGKLNVDIINKVVDDVIGVSDQEIASSVMFLLERSKLVVEPAGATTVAALENIDITNKKVVCLLSGGNIDITTIHDIIDRGLAARKRIVEISLKVPDSPNSVKQVLEVLLDCGAYLLEFSVDKVYPSSDIDNQCLYMRIETNGLSHYNEICKKFNSMGFKFVW